MESILEKTFIETYKIDSNISTSDIVDVDKFESDLKYNYGIRFTFYRLKELLLKYDFIRECKGSFSYLKGSKPTVKSVDKEDVQKSVDIFLLRIVRLYKNCNLYNIKESISINYGLALCDDTIIKYIKMIALSDKGYDKELVKSLISERKDTTSEVIKKVSDILDLDESKTAILLAENGYKFKISDSKVQESINVEIKNLTSSDKIDYEKVINLCNIIN